MKLPMKFAVSGVLCTVIWGAETYWVNIMQSDISRELAIRQLNGGNGAFDRMRAFESAKEIIHTAGLFAMIVVAWIVFSAPPSRSRHLTRWPMLIIMLSMAGCMRQYDKPEYILIDTSETGFLIPLEGNSGEQAKFESEEYLKANKAPSKRVQITHR